MITLLNKLHLSLPKLPDVANDENIINLGFTFEKFQRRKLDFSITISTV